MPGPLHVLVYGSVDHGVCDYYRFGMHRAALAEQGVDLRPMNSIRYRSSGGRDFLEAAGDEDFTIDRDQLDWADVIVFRRFYQTLWNCSRCPGVAGGRDEVQAHARLAGGTHIAQPPDPIVRPIFAALERNPRLLNGRAIVYEADDNLLDIKTWNGVSARLERERDVVERMLRRADLVTTTTPFLAQAFGRYNKAVRVVRNAIDPESYTPTGTITVTGEPRLLYYGGSVRVRDYEIAREGVERAKAAVPDLRRVWVGTRHGGDATPKDLLIESMMEETYPVTESVPAFHRLLADLRPHIGIAPIVGDEFDRAKSELHWLEYSVVGAATVATRTMRPGPFDPIRHGVDGFLARGKGEWIDAIGRLARSKDLREEIGGRARERVMAEYTTVARAPDWAAAYRWAAEHPGHGARPPLYAGWAEPDAVADARACLEHRMEQRDLVATADVRLAAVRAQFGGEAACPPGDRVSVLVPVVDSAPALLDRALASVAAQAHPPFEVIVAGPAGWAREAMLAGLPAALAPVVRWVEWTPVAPAPGRDVAAIGLGRALAAAAAEASGDWIVPLSPEGELMPDHVATLLEVAREHALEFVFGQSDVDFGEGARLRLGTWPPRADFVLTLGSELFAAPLLAFAPFDPDAWREGETAGWSLWRRCYEAGVRMASIEEPVHRLAPLGQLAA